MIDKQNEQLKKHQHEPKNLMSVFLDHSFDLFPVYKHVHACCLQKSAFYTVKKPSCFLRYLFKKNPV